MVERLKMNVPINVELDIEDISHIISELSYNVSKYDDCKKEKRIHEVIRYLERMIRYG